MRPHSSRPLQYEDGVGGSQRGAASSGTNTGNRRAGKCRHGKTWGWKGTRGLHGCYGFVFLFFFYRRGGERGETRGGKGGREMRCASISVKQQRWPAGAWRHRLEKKQGVRVGPRLMTEMLRKKNRHGAVFFSRASVVVASFVRLHRAALSAHPAVVTLSCVWSETSRGWVHRLELILIYMCYSRCVDRAGAQTASLRVQSVQAGNILVSPFSYFCVI